VLTISPLCPFLGSCPSFAHPTGDPVSTPWEPPSWAGPEPPLSLKAFHFALQGLPSIMFPSSSPSWGIPQAELSSPSHILHGQFSDEPLSRACYSREKTTTSPKVTPPFVGKPTPEMGWHEDTKLSHLSPIQDDTESHPNLGLPGELSQCF
jgi:hypothetical protein